MTSETDIETISITSIDICERVHPIPHTWDEDLVLREQLIAIEASYRLMT